MGRIFDAVTTYLQAEGIRFEIAGQTTALRFGFRTETHNWLVVAEVRETQDLLILASLLPDTVPEERRGAVAELETRINSGLAIGNFELEWSSGLVRFRTSLDLEGSEPGTPLIRQLLRANIATTARFAAAIARVARGEAAPADALAAVVGGGGGGGG